MAKRSNAGARSSRIVACRDRHQNGFLVVHQGFVRFQFLGDDKGIQASEIQDRPVAAWSDYQIGPRIGGVASVAPLLGGAPLGRRTRWGRRRTATEPWVGENPPSRGRRGQVGGGMRVTGRGGGVLGGKWGFRPGFVPESCVFSSWAMIRASKRPKSRTGQ